MIIDFHTHIWPERIARQTVTKLKQAGGIPAYTDGTLLNLQEAMKEAGVDLSVVLPVVTRPEQFEGVNRFACEVCKQEDILSFGGIHPDNEQVEHKLEQIKDMGLKGIKLHPDYQGVFIDDERYQRIISYALEIGLIVVVHAGMDVGLPDPIHCSPERILRLYEMLHLGDNVDNKLVFAHTGGYACWDQVYDQLAGLKIYFDCSTTLGVISDTLFIDIVRKHGSNRIVFGTDAPWTSHKEMITYLENMPLTVQEKNNILGETGRYLLGV